MLVYEVRMDLPTSIHYNGWIGDSKLSGYSLLSTFTNSTYHHYSVILCYDVITSQPWNTTYVMESYRGRNPTVAQTKH